MVLTLEPATLRDFPTFTDIYMKAFQDQIALQCFPRTEEVIQWWTAVNEGDFRDQPSARFLKIVEDDKIISYAKWNVPVQLEGGTTSGGDDPDEMPTWPRSGDTELCDEFFGTLARKHKEIMGDQAHYYLEIIATLPEHQGRGAAGKLISWGLHQADKSGLSSYIEASPLVVSLYERYGWRTVETFKPSKVEHVESMMVRPPRLERQQI